MVQLDQTEVQHTQSNVNTTACIRTSAKPICTASNKVFSNY